MRIAIIGAGIAGLTAAWLLDEDHDVTVYEADDRPGGNIRTVPVPTPENGTVHVDLGAQFLSPTAYPDHSALCRALGITAEDITAVPLTTSLLHAGQDEPLLVTPHAPGDAAAGRKPLTGPAWEALGAFLAQAARLEADDGPETTTVADLAGPLGLTDDLYRHAVLAWCASFVGCTLDQAARMPARAAAAWATRTPPEHAEAAPIWHTLTSGLGTVTHRLATALKTPVRCRTSVRHISLNADGPVVHCSRGHELPYDSVILALPAPQAATLLRQCPPLARTAADLSEFTYVPTTVALHRDPRHMPADRAHWSSANTTSDGHWAETTSWLGPHLGTDLFKSWITHRTPPDDIIATAHFHQLLPTVPGRLAAARLAAGQGQHGIHCAGSHLHDADSQQGAVRSALDTARTLAPHSHRLKSLAAS
ncbi:FAD-dependent oxidoreductase [Streptomyces formicae]|uniref:Amine oxidase, flavin-containing n=1 Tax=Streptomyces formicae TaxID=1616117 RepID=A0A291QNC2_9ACTN|nr:FAD-dependent oxidoreductase [Streptomyces formicae]ATL33014.1 Amine oxidase, flavin-containing [Streptomyces formicae]